MTKELRINLNERDGENFWQTQIRRLGIRLLKLRKYSDIKCLIFSMNISDKVHVKWVPCHHGMVRPQVEDRGDCLQIWRAAANILNKQLWRADSGWPSSLGVGQGANNPPP
jgi:hypothetical protein